MKNYTKKEFDEISHRFKGDYKIEWGYLLVDENGKRYIMDGVTCDIYVLCDLWVMRDIALITDVFTIRNNKVVEL